MASPDPNDEQQQSNFNEGANFWHYDIGVPTIPGEFKTKKPSVNWAHYQQNPPTEMEHKNWLNQGKYSGGVFVFCGKACFRKDRENLFLVGIDIDRQKGIDAFCTRDGKTTTIEEMAAHTLVEQHDDAPDRLHMFFYFPFKIPVKPPDTILGIEVKSSWDHGIMRVFPSVTENGYPLKVIGSAREPVELNELQANELVQYINHICIDNGVKYLQEDGNDTSTSKYLTPELRQVIKSQDVSFATKDKVKIASGKRNVTLIVVADSILFNLLDNDRTNEDRLKKFFFAINFFLCDPEPLPEKELESVWNSAIKWAWPRILNEILHGTRRGRGTTNEKTKEEENREKEEQQQAQQELVDENHDDEDSKDELKGIYSDIIIQLDSHVSAVISSNPPVLYVAHRGQKCIRKVVIKFGTKEVESKDAEGKITKSSVETQSLLFKQKLIYAIPLKVIINNNPLTDNRTYVITFISSKRNKKPFTIGPATIVGIIEHLDKKGRILKKPEATDALTAIVERYDELELADVREGITEPGYYWIDDQIRAYNINQRLDLDPTNNEDRKAVLECINTLEEFQTRSKKKVAFPTVLKWGILAPFSFITKTQTPGVEDWLPWLYLYDSTDTGKTTLIINAVLAIWGRYDKQQFELHFRGPGSVDTPSKLGITLSQTTYPILVDEVGGLLNDDSRHDNVLLDMIKYSVQGKFVRSRFHENILALSPLAFTSNDPPPQDSAYRRRFVAIQFYENEKWSETEKEEFKRWLDEQGIRDKLKVLGDFVARYVIERPEILGYSSYSWNERASAILKAFYKSVDVEPPDWIDLIAEQTLVQEVGEERQFEIRGFLQQAILEGYRRDYFTNPDQSTLDNDGKRMLTNVTFEQKFVYCLDNKSLPFLHHCKRNSGEGSEVAITSNIRSELKRYSKSISMTTMNALATQIPGFKYEKRSIGNRPFRVICGPMSKLLEFLNCEIEEKEGVGIVDK